MTVQPLVLDAGEAVELGELLEFLRCWIERDGDRLAGSFRRFMGADGYHVNDLRADLTRFALLLGGHDGELFLGGGAR